MTLLSWEHCRESNGRVPDGTCASVFGYGTRNHPNMDLQES